MVYLLDVALPRPVKNQRQENVPTHIFTPRTYQVEVLDLAIKRNTIVCLSSNSNRTFLSVMLIKVMAHQVRSKSHDFNGFPSEEDLKHLASDSDGQDDTSSPAPEMSQELQEAPEALPDVALEKEPETVPQVAPEKNMICTICLINSGSQSEELMKMVHRHTDLQVLEIREAGEELTCEQWSDFLSSHSVILMSGKTLLYALQSGYCEMPSINLLIFDDCHLAMDAAHPYHQVMAEYHACPAESQPRILGLTYSILQSPCSTPQELEDYLMKLEQSLCSIAETATDVGELDFYGAKPAEHVLDCESFKDKFGLREEIESIIYSAVTFLDEGVWTIESDAENGTNSKEVCLNILTEVYSVLVLLGPWAAGFVAQALSKQFGKQEELTATEEGERLVRFCHSKLKMIYLLVERFYEKEVQDIDDFLALMSPKVIELIKILHAYKPDDNFMIIGDDLMDDIDDGEETDDSFDLSDDEENEEKDDKKSKANVHYVAVKRIDPDEEPKEKEENNLCGLVFVNRPHTALALNKLLQELCNWDPDLFFLQSHHLTWSDSLLTTAELKQCKEMSMMHRRQEETLRKFRNREVNLLVAWSALQEGVDLPRCNLVICFDLPEDYRGYVYSKGKARAPKAQFYLLVDEVTECNFSKELDVIKGIENILALKCQNYETVEEMTESDKEKVDLCLAPYTPCPEDSNAAKVVMSNGIGLVNRYCAKLPSDAFTHLTPKCAVEECPGEDGVTRFRAILQLPINSPIKQPIVGDAMETSRLAKMAVALKACSILHSQGELDNNLLPVGKEMVKYEDEEAEWEEHEAQGQARPGTTKRKQYYNKKIAQPLLGKPVEEKKCFLYTISMVLTCPITEEQNTRGRKIHAPEDTPRMFGIISEKLIPLVPQFPVFTRSGEVTASIDLVQDDLILSKEKLDRLVAFHHLVFAKVLRLEKDPMRFDFTNAESSYVIIPLHRGEQNELIIDWNFVKVVEDNPVTERQIQVTKNGKENKENVKKRPLFVFDETKFEDAVVMPSYRNIDQPQYFYVAEIRNDLTPKSPFPSPELYETFQKYYSSKYGLEITNIKQPLLDVDHTSARLNLLTPRYMNQKGVALPTSSAETRRARRENLQQKQILVPELCDVHPFPASLWRKAVCLPAILYRVNCLLIADELRMTIADGAHIGVVQLSPDFRFPQLEFGFSTKPSDLIKSGEEEQNTEQNTNKKNVDDDDDEEEEEEDEKIHKGETTKQVKENKEGQDESLEVKKEPESKEKTANNKSKDGEKTVDPEKEKNTEKQAEKEKNTEKQAEKERNTGKQAEQGKNTEKQPEETVQDNSSNKGSPENKEEKTKPKRKRNKKKKKQNSQDGPSEKSQESMDHAPESTCDSNSPNKKVDGITEKVQEMTLNSKNSVKLTSNGISNDISARAEAVATEKPASKGTKNIDDILPPSTVTQEDIDAQEKWKLDMSAFEKDTMMQQINKMMSGEPQEEEGVKITELPPDADESTLAQELDKDDPWLADDRYDNEPTNDPEVKPTIVYKPLNDSLKIDTDLWPSGISGKPQDPLLSTPKSTSSYNTAEESLSPTSFCSLSPAQTPKKSPRKNVSLKAEDVKDNWDGDSSDQEDARTIETSEIAESSEILEPENNIDKDGNMIIGHWNKTESDEDDDDDDEELPIPQNDKSKNVKINGDLAKDNNKPVNSVNTDEAESKEDEDDEDSSKNPQKQIDSSLKVVAVSTYRGCLVEKPEGLCYVPSSFTCPDSQEQAVIEIEEQDCNLSVRFDEQCDLQNFIGPSPCIILQTLTMSNANDFFNLERQETIGDSFLKFAITVYLYCTYPGIHEGKLSYLRSKQVSNYNLYKLGKRKQFPECMVASKFEPTENWLPPGYVIKKNNAYKGLSVLMAMAANMEKEQQSAGGGDARSGAPESAKDGKDSCKESQDGKDPSRESPDGKDHPKESLNGKDHSKESQDGKVPSKESLDGKDPSKESHDGEDHPKESQDGKDSSKASPDGKYHSKESQDKKDLSKESPDGKDPSKESHVSADSIETHSSETDSPSCDSKESYPGGSMKEGETEKEQKEDGSTAEEPQREQEDKKPQSQETKDGSISIEQDAEQKSQDDDLIITKGSKDLCSAKSPSKSNSDSDDSNNLINPTSQSCDHKTEPCSSNELEAPSEGPSNTVACNTPPSKTAQNEGVSSWLEEELFIEELEAAMKAEEGEKEETEEDLQCVIPYNLQTQHSLPDKSIADCVEALIGCYLTTCGHRAALQFMSWLGLKVLPIPKREKKDGGKRGVRTYGYLVAPPSPLLSHVENASDVLRHHLDGYDAFEEQIQYKFKDKSYLLQAFTHASYHYNTVTDCYQRLEFLGDAILDYVITRHLYEDSKKHSPGILTDLRSALVNNNIFAALAVKWNFHKYFKAVSPQLFTVIEKFVAWQKDKGDEIDLDEEFEEDEDGEAHQEREDIEIPKALGDIFESVAGAIYLDSGMSLDTVWQVYYRLMKPQIDAFTSKIPKSPVRELLEMEPETAKFEKPERTLDGKIRVTVNVVGKGRFHGVGRNYRIAKSAAAKRALKFIRMMQQQIDMYEMAMGAQEMAFGRPENMLPFGGPGGPESMMNFIEFDQ